jgi:integrase
MSKRGNGEGTVFQRQDGRWQGQVSVPADGLQKARRLTVYGKTQREVLEKLRACQAQALSGRTPNSRTMTVADYGRLWLDGTKAAEVVRGHNTQSTLRNYRDLWERHIAPDLGHLRLDKITPAVLRQWLARKATQRSAHGTRSLSPNTQVRIYGVLRAALNDAVNDGLLLGNPLNRVRAPRTDTSKVLPLTGEQVAVLLRGLEGKPLFTLVLLMLATGARPGEALGASWADVDLERGQWHISRTLGRVPVDAELRRTRLAFTKTKTPASTATVALPAVAVTELRRHRLVQARQRLLAPVWGDADLVFATAVGTPLEARNVRRELQAIAAAADLGRSVRLHDLRHTAASALMAEGVRIEVTSKLLRHTRLATTSDVYSHLLDEVRTDAAEVLNRRLQGLLAMGHASKPSQLHDEN